MGAYMYAKYRQTVWTQIRLLLEEQFLGAVWSGSLLEQFDLGPYCLLQCSEDLERLAAEETINY